MPQRINIVGDLGTTKLASDSYDIDNIYLTEEGWVYRHFKSTDGSRYWDEIIVAGEVVEAGNEPCAETNPPKLGTIASPQYETGDGEFDWEYSEHQVTGTPGSYTTKVEATGGGVPTFDDTPAAPDPDVTIGTISFDNTTGTATQGDTVTYTASYDGDAPSDQISYQWGITGATHAGGGGDSNTITVLFDTVGDAVVSLTINGTSDSVTDSGQGVTLNVTVSA